MNEQNLPLSDKELEEWETGRDLIKEINDGIDEMKKKELDKE
jgi:hypothetical protein